MVPVVVVVVQVKQDRLDIMVVQLAAEAMDYHIL
jgi:hypothetical protein